MFVLLYKNAPQAKPFLVSIQRTGYDSYYPFKILSKNDLYRLDFDTVTILYGGNGSGKSTALNVIAEKTGISRDTIYNKSNLFPDYVDLCEINTEEDIPKNSRIITSDDAMDNVREYSNGESAFIYFTEKIGERVLIY